MLFIILFDKSPALIDENKTLGNFTRVIVGLQSYMRHKVMWQQYRVKEYELQVGSFWL